MNIIEFNVTNNRVRFAFEYNHPEDGQTTEAYSVKFPGEYQFGREYYDLMKDIPLCLWANTIGILQPDRTPELCFDVSEEQLQFWLWVAEKTAQHEAYLNEEEPYEVPNPGEVKTGSDPSTLVPSTLPEKEWSGALICQSTGKESVASKIMLDKMGVEHQSMFYEYPSRAATHKIRGREEFEEYFDNPTLRVWSDANSLQSTLNDLTDNYMVATQFWEQMYVTMALPLAIEEGLQYILLGNETSAGEPKHGSDYVTWEDFNQSFVYELAYTDYLKQVHGLEQELTSVIEPMSSFACRKVVLENEPEFYKNIQSCLRPTPDKEWCLGCYKCERAWIETVCLGADPEEMGLSHEVLRENPHLGGERDDWGYSTPMYNRDEQIWQDYNGWQKAQQFDFEEMELDGRFDLWRSRQDERVEQEEVNKYSKYNGKYVTKLAQVIPKELQFNPGLEETDYCPSEYDPGKYVQFATEWRQPVPTLEQFS